MTTAYADSMIEDLTSTRVPPGSVRLWWLGQAGFVFKSASGAIVYLDPCLSDACERLHGFKRLTLAPLQAEDVRADLVVLTHEHTDHLDPDALPVIAQRNPGCRFAGPAGCTEGLHTAGITDERFVLMQPRQRYDLGVVTIDTVQADHGDLSPTALAMVLSFGDLRVLVSGDTSWRPVMFQPLYDLKPQVAIVVINGTFGNMNHLDAAMMVQQAQPRIAIPSHFWTFAEQGGGDPGGFCYACRQVCPDVRPQLLKPGEGLTVTPD